MTQCRGWDGKIDAALDSAQNVVAGVVAGMETWVVAVGVGIGTE